MDALLQNQAAVVTGGASGIGRAICRRFAEHGASVVVADLHAEPREGGTPTHEVLRDEFDADARFVECDVSDPDQLEAAVAAADEFGGVDVMVNNAGIFRAEAFLDVTEDEFDRLVGVNVKGTFFGAQAAARRMVDGDGGSIVNLSSIAGLRGYGPYPTYCASKGAVRLLTYALADHLGPEGVRVNVIHPGLIDTEMTRSDVHILGTEAGEDMEAAIPSRRAGQPGEIADAALYLASDMGGYVNGESLTVDGGLTNTG